MKKLKIYFYAFEISGPQNACLGLSQAFARLGHDVQVMVSRSIAGKYAKHDIREHILEPVEELNNVDPVRQICDMIVEHKLFDHADKIVNLRRVIECGFFESFYDNWVAFDPQMKQILARDKPDLIVVESEIIPPSLVYSGIPYVYFYSSNPLGLFQSEDLPPFTSGMPTDSDRKLWAEFRQEAKTIHTKVVVEMQDKICAHFGYPPLKTRTIIPVSSFLNLYQYPLEFDYSDSAKLPDSCFRLDNFCRNGEEPFEIPVDFKSRIKPGGKLIYLSLGSMGCCNLKLMNRLISILSKTEHFVIVSKGVLADQIELPSNMWGLPSLPQTQVLQTVDLFITHGGNNSFVESCRFGVPVIVFPIIYDQFDNAQRVVDKKLGFSFDPHTFEDQDLLDAVEKMLNDDNIIRRWRQMSDRIQKDDRFEAASQEIQRRLALIEN